MATRAAPRESYGHVMLDMGYQKEHGDPDWFDVLRPTQLLASEDRFGEDGEWFSGVRQRRLGFKTVTPSSFGERMSTIGYSMVDINDSSWQTPDALKKGEYPLANVQFSVQYNFSRAPGGG